MTTLIEQMSEGICRLDFTVPENLNFLNYFLRDQELPEFSPNFLNDEEVRDYKFLRFLDDDELQLTNNPARALGEDLIWLAAALAIEAIFEEEPEVPIPAGLRRVWELF